MAIDAFLELIGPGGQAISGESTDATFKKKIALRSVTLSSQGAEKKTDNTTSNTATDTGSTTSTTATTSGSKRRFMLNLTITKDVDSASPELFQEYCRKAEIKDALKFEKAKISLRKSQGQLELVFLVMEFTDLFIAKYSVEVNDGKLPLETVGLSFNSCTLTYTAQKASGSNQSPFIAGWDFDKNKSKSH